MRRSISRSAESIWVWLFWGLGIYLALELGPFLIAARVLKKTLGELAGPYLAFAAPAAIIMPLVWWLRRWEQQGVPPKRLARGWGLSMALFGIAVTAALYCSGVKLRLVNSMDAVADLAVSALIGVPILYFGMYYRMLTIILSRTSGKPGSCRPK